MDTMLESAVGNPDFAVVRHLVSAWIRRRQGERKPPDVAEGMDVHDPGWLSQYEHMGFPDTVDKKMDELLKAYGDEVGDRYTLEIDFLELPHLISKVAAKGLGEVVALDDLLRQLGYVHSSHYGRTAITARGWQRIGELRQSTESGDTAFVAMWFDRCTEDYWKAAESAIAHCRYRPVRVDQEDFNGFIMDQVVSLIRQARFVVADFTCEPEIDSEENDRVRCGVRGGVYWEAGMAYGLGKPVVHTCQESEHSNRRRHFDVDQYNTIFWKPGQLDPAVREHPDEVRDPSFAEKLAARILATVGMGSYVEEKKQGG